MGSVAEATHPTTYWHAEGDRIQCDVCPRFCRLKEGQEGHCFVRAARGGEIVLTTYGRSSGFCVDPIEKKPLNHFLPGTSVLSFGTAGCNLACRFCQNWDISKSREMDSLQSVASPEGIARAAVERGYDVAILSRGGRMGGEGPVPGTTSFRGDIRTMSETEWRAALEGRPLHGLVGPRRQVPVPLLQVPGRLLITPRRFGKPPLPVKEFAREKGGDPQHGRVPGPLGEPPELIDTNRGLPVPAGSLEEASEREFYPGHGLPSPVPLRNHLRLGENADLLVYGHQILEGGHLRKDTVEKKSCGKHAGRVSFKVLQEPVIVLNGSLFLTQAVEMVCRLFYEFESSLDIP